MNIDVRLRPFYVAKILSERTDEEHDITIVQIIEILKSEYGISTTRGTITDDITVLKKLGMNIDVQLKSQNHYSLIGRDFDLPEIKTLIDAVESAKFISKERSGILVKKLEKMTSMHQRADITRNVDVENRIKSDNGDIFRITDVLNRAINVGKKVTFQYFSYNVRKEKKLKHDGYVYTLSPYKLIWNGDYYYVVGYSEKHNGIGSFRIDRIANCLKIINEEAVEPPHDFDLNFFLNSMFRMYNGERKEVELICDNDVMDAIIDRFGADVTILANDMKSFRAVVNIATGNVFYSWVFGFGGKVKISEPMNVRKEYENMVRKAAEKLN